jgi:hypothetical protein
MRGTRLARGRVVRLRASAVVSLAVALLVPALSWRAIHANTGRWNPPRATSWQWQLTGTLDLSVNAAMFDIDLFDTPASTVAALHARGRRAVCYLSAGTWENWRPDAARFPSEILGSVVSGWPDERWLDIRRLDVLAPIMAARLDQCRDKGFDGVEPDNVDGYANRSGFPLRAADQIRYNRWLADAAHARGLSVGLKNDLDQIPQLVDVFDWALAEQCFEYDECERLQPFVAAGKAVFVVEYKIAAAVFCPLATQMGFNAMRKNLSLNAFREACPAPRPVSPGNVRIVK